MRKEFPLCGRLSIESSHATATQHNTTQGAFPCLSVWGWWSGLVWSGGPLNVNLNGSTTTIFTHSLALSLAVPGWLPHNGNDLDMEQ